MKNKLAFTAIVFAMLIVVLNACRHEILDPLSNGSGGSGGGTPLPTSTCSPDTVYFANQVMPLISSNCTMSGCHDNITHVDGVNLTTYTNIMRYVQAGNAANSKLYKSIMY